MGARKERTQASEVLHYMQTHKRGITSMQAIERFGATRLSDIIYRLKKLGFEIESESITEKNRYGHTVTYSRYYLAK